MELERLAVLVIGQFPRTCPVMDCLFTDTEEGHHLLGIEVIISDRSYNIVSIAGLLIIHLAFSQVELNDSVSISGSRSISTKYISQYNIHAYKHTHEIAIPKMHPRC